MSKYIYICRYAVENIIYLCKYNVYISKYMYIIIYTYILYIRSNPYSVFVCFDVRSYLMNPMTDLPHIGELSRTAHKRS